MKLARVSFASFVCMLTAQLAMGDVLSPVRYSTIALSGQAAPGAGAGVNYVSFDTPNYNASGQLSFAVTLTGTGITTSNDTAIYGGSFSSPQLVAREGSQAPGTGAGVNYANCNFGGAVNTTGDVAFTVGNPSLAGPAVTTANDSALFAGSASTPQLIAREGNPAPGTAGLNYSSTNSYGLSDAGRLAYGINLSGAGVTSANDEAIYAGSFSSPQLVVREGDAAPGAGVATTYVGPRLQSVAAGGRFGFSTSFGGASVSISNDEAIYAGDFASPQIIAREGSPAPGTAAGVLYSTGMGIVTLNNTGGVTFSAPLKGTGITTSNDKAIYAGPIASPQIVAREGNAAPGLPAGATYETVYTAAINDNLEVAYVVNLKGTGVTSSNDVALYAGNLANPQLIAREGDPAPGTPAGVTYSAFTNPPGLTSGGQVIYFGVLAGPGVTTANDYGLYIFDPILGQRLLAREGDAFDIGNGTLRTISGAIGDIGAPFSSNMPPDTIAFRLHFTDGSEGLFTATVPEPATFSLALMSAGLILRRNRRGR